MGLKTICQVNLRTSCSSNQVAVHFAHGDFAFWLNFFVFIIKTLKVFILKVTSNFHFILVIVRFKSSTRFEK